MRLVWVGCLCLLSGCLSRVAVTRAAEPAAVAVAYVFDQEFGAPLAAIPPEVQAQVAAQLARRNLKARTIPQEAYRTIVEGTRDSRRRFRSLAAHAGGAPFVLLVETRATFFSQLSGRYRWLVSARLTAGRADGSGEPSERHFEHPAYVNFDHEREAEALAVAAHTLGEHAGALFDDLLPPAVEAASAGRLPGPVYFVLVDRFANGDPSNDGAIDRNDPAAFHGGDLQGVIDQLDYLQGLGVRTLWLSPVFQMRTQPFEGHGAFHGYWVEDLTRVEPRFGTPALLKRLSDELRRRQMGLVLDMVFNHVAPDAPLVHQRPEWFHRRGSISDWNDPSQWESHDVHGLPDLAQEREEVFQFLLQTSLSWIQAVKPVGFRLDAVKHLPLSFWARFNRELKRRAGPGFVLLGEMYDGRAAVLSRVQREAGFDAMFDFPLYFALVDVFCRQASPAKVAAVLSEDRRYDAPDSLVTLADNHDLPRVLSECGGQVEQVAQLLTVQLLARGTPSLNYGTEQGLTGAREPENRGDFRRTGHALQSQVTALLALRARHPALHRGVSALLEAGTHHASFVRAVPEELVVVSINQGPAPRQVSLPPEVKAERWVDLLTGQPLPRQVISVRPRSVRVVRVTPPAHTRFEPFLQRLAHWKQDRRWVEFQVDGEQLVGSSPELGDWALASALVPDEQGTVRVRLPVRSVYELKLVRRTASGTAEWEAGENRRLFVPEGSQPLRVALHWGRAMKEEP